MHGVLGDLTGESAGDADAPISTSRVASVLPPAGAEVEAVGAVARASLSAGRHTPQLGHAWIR